MKKEYMVNIIFSLIATISFFQIIKLNNEARLPQNINMDYYTNSLLYIYIILISLGVLTIFNIYMLGMSGKKYNLK